MDTDVIAGVLFAVGVFFLYHLRSWRTRPPLPPGPKPLPIIGNQRQLPRQRNWVTYGEWAKKYGEIVHVTNWGKHMIILNSAEAVNALLDHKSSIYSSRPQSIMLKELMDFSTITVTLPYGNQWRSHRSLFTKQMHVGAMAQFEPLQRRAIRRLLINLLDSPEDFRKHIRHMAAMVVMEFTYGYTIKPTDDEYVKMSELNSRAFATAIVPGSWMVDHFPWLRYIPEWLPGAGFKRFAKTSRKTIEGVRDGLFNQVQSQLKAGVARPSFVANSLSDFGTEPPSEEELDAIKMVAAGIFAAGTGTTTASAVVFILAMILHPDVFLKAQRELDAVVGDGRLPEHSDRPALPYVTAVVKEVLRWITVAPIGVPHATIEEDVYRGYRIPAGSAVIPNTWAILHDPEVYPEPNKFIPERFIPDASGNIQKDPVAVFGFGRRICAGKNLGDDTVWLVMASLLSVFDITYARDGSGEKIDVSQAADPVGNILAEAGPFVCSILPRSEKAENLIRMSALMGQD